MQGLTKGRIVHFCFQLEGMSSINEYAAIISQVHRENHPEQYPTGSLNSLCEPHEDGDVALFAFMENSPVVFHDVAYSAEKLPNTWHWIEKA